MTTQTPCTRSKTAFRAPLTTTTKMTFSSAKSRARTRSRATTGNSSRAPETTPRLCTEKAERPSPAAPKLPAPRNAARQPRTCLSRKSSWRRTRRLLASQSRRPTPWSSRSTTTKCRSSRRWSSARLRRRLPRQSKNLSAGNAGKRRRSRRPGESGSRCIRR